MKMYGKNMLDPKKVLAVVKNDKPDEYDVVYFNAPSFAVALTEEEFNQLAKDVA